MNKVSALVFFIGVIVSPSAIAQQTSLNGPAAKNMSPSEKYKGGNTILVRGNQHLVKGPRAKNQGAWEIDRSGYKIVKMDQLNGKNLRGLQGPAYKNTGFEKISSIQYWVAKK